MASLWDVLRTHDKDALAVENAIGGLLPFCIRNAQSLFVIEQAYHAGGVIAIVRSCGAQLESLWNDAGGWTKLKPVMPNIANLIEALQK